MASDKHARAGYPPVNTSVTRMLAWVLKLKNVSAEHLLPSFNSGAIAMQYSWTKDLCNARNQGCKMIIMRTITSTTINIIMVIIVGVEGINKAWLWTNPLICGHELEHKDHGRRDNVQKRTLLHKTPMSVTMCYTIYRCAMCYIMHYIKCTTL